MVLELECCVKDKKNNFKILKWDEVCSKYVQIM